MRVVVAPDKFKGSLTASEAAEAIQRGMQSALHDAQIDLCPMADGGEGTLEAFVRTGARSYSTRVCGPLGEDVDAPYAVKGDVAILEMAAASGLALLNESQYDPLHASTYGTGQLLCAVLDADLRRIIMGLGGSATNDAGVGMLRALGARFLDDFGDEIDGGVLDYRRLAEIDLTGLDERLKSVEIRAALDVDNPLCGPNGASYAFARQKGANDAQIALLDRTLEHIADVAERTLGHDDRDRPGAGAAGGLGFALAAFLGAKMERGFDVIARECGLERLLDGAQLCATGEGKIDEQTLHGKTVFGVAKLAQHAGVPVVAFAGVVEDGVAQKLEQSGVTVRTIAPEDVTSEDSRANAAAYLEKAARDYAGVFVRSVRG